MLLTHFTIMLSASAPHLLLSGSTPLHSSTLPLCPGEDECAISDQNTEALQILAMDFIIQLLHLGRQTIGRGESHGNDAKVFPPSLCPGVQLRVTPATSSPLPHLAEWGHLALCQCAQLSLGYDKVVNLHWSHS